MDAERKALARARRIIVKIGSNALAEHPDLIANIAADVAELSARGLSRLSSLESARVAGAFRDAPLPLYPKDAPDVVVHEADLVLLD